MAVRARSFVILGAGHRDYTGAVSERPAGALRRLRENWEVLREILALIRLHRRWALLPVWLVLAALSLFIALAGGGSVLPAIYALF